MPNINIKSWNRFIIPNFCVSASVMGLAHQFIFDNLDVKIKLPPREHADRDFKYNDVASLESSQAETNEPINYNVKKVDVEISEPNQISVPLEALEKPPKQFQYFSEEQKAAIDKITEIHSSVAKKAFNYWLDILRWSSNNAFIGQHQIYGNDSGWSTHIIDKETNKMVWIESMVISFPFFSEVTSEHWSLAQSRLMKNQSIPIHFKYLHSAEESNRNQLFQKAIVELAMSCEIFLRHSTLEFIPKSTPPDLVQYIEEANINKYVTSFFKHLVPQSQQKEYKKIQKVISSLINHRNSYLHMGTMNVVDQKKCYEYIAAIKKLFEIKLISQ